MTIRVAITGHTRGIGEAVHNYFESLGAIVEGFSRSNGYDISNEDVNKLIIHEIKDYDIFVNNAYDPFGQVDLLNKIIACWKTDSAKLIINISSRYTTDPTKKYCQTKSKLDEITRDTIYNGKIRCHVINLKPGLVATDSVADVEGPRMNTWDIVSVLDWILAPKPFRVHEITFGTQR